MSKSRSNSTRKPWRPTGCSVTKTGRWRIKKFRDNRQDGGEVGAGHEVTALYELDLNRGAKGASLATVHVRWKNSEGTEVFELAREARMNEHYAMFERIRPETRLAFVAGQFAEMLKGTGYAADESYEQLYRLAEPLRRELRANRLMTCSI